MKHLKIYGPLTGLRHRIVRNASLPSDGMTGTDTVSQQVIR
ncbi:MAG: hypothetical protein ACU84J_14230 [Gammaproteobacteria bacterium]